MLVTLSAAAGAALPAVGSAIGALLTSLLGIAL